MPSNASKPALCLVVMGPSGTGKTTTAKLLSQRLGWKFAEADEFHPKANIDKMSAGIPLNDEDRAPWLASIRDWISDEAGMGESTVITCSALKRRYRDILRGAEARVRFVELDAPEGVIGAGSPSARAITCPRPSLPRNMPISSRWKPTRTGSRFPSNRTRTGS